MGQPEHPPIIVKTYDFTLWLLPKVEKFSRVLALRFRLFEASGKQQSRELA